MKRFFFLFCYIYFCSLPIFCIENTQKYKKEPVIELEIQKEQEKDEKTSQEEDSLLLKDFISIFDYTPEIDIEGKIIDKIEFGGAYQGALTFDTFQGSSNTKLIQDISVTDLYMLTKFTDKKSELKLMINPVRTIKGVDYFQGILQDIYFATKPTENTKILLGHSRTPVGKEGGQSSYTLPTVQRAQIARNHGDFRALGIKLTGDYKYLDYNVGIYDSSRYFTNMFNGMEFTGWVNAKPFANLDSEKYGKLITGFGYQTGKRNTSYSVLGAYIEYQYKKLMLNVEYSFADGFNGKNNKKNNAEGFYTTLTYKLHPKVELVARYDLYNPNKKIKNNNITEITTGINYYLKENKIKFMLDYVFTLNEKERNSNGLLFMTQFMI